MERTKARQQVFEHLYRSKKVGFCRDNMVAEENLNKPQLKEVFNETMTAFKGFLKNLDALEVPDEATLQEIIDSVPEAESDT